MNERTESTAPTGATFGDGFRISEQPLVGTAERPEPADDLPASYGTDLLYLIARDPYSLFLYWDLNWTKAFERAGLSPRQIHLRVYRGDGSLEGTREINPFRGHCYVDVSGAGEVYYCELGCLEGEEWQSLAQSGTTTTPEAGVSEDLSATFAALPLHLSFQRLLDIFHSPKSDAKNLAGTVAELQENARRLQATMTPAEWSQLLAATAISLNGDDPRADPGTAADLSALLESARELTRTPLTPEQRAKWRELSERFGGASWGGASEGSGPA